jgi:hypothetical protein
MHPRQQIREQVAAILTGATVAGANVFPSRKINFRAAELPAIAIYTLGTDSEVRDESPRAHRRTTTLVVELRVQSGSSIDEVDDPLDDFCLQVENLLDYDRYLLDIAENVTPTGTDIVLDPAGDRVVGVAAMSYEVVYNQCAAENPASAVPFEEAAATYNLDGAVDPGNQVHDLLELEGDQNP